MVEILKKGTWIKTTKPKKDVDFIPEALLKRKWNVYGTILGHHDSHGLYYDVLHCDGSLGPYDPEELVLAPIVSKIKKIYIITTVSMGMKYANKKRSPDGVYRSYLKRTSPNQEEYYTIRDRRTWGWFTDLKIAKKAVEENWGDIFEGLYWMAVIEETPEGIVTNLPTKEYWFKWKGTWENGSYKPIKKPKECKDIVGFWEHVRGLKDDE